MRLKSKSHPLNDFLARHALGNDRRGLGKTFVLRPPGDADDLPPVLGFYTLSMATLDSSAASPHVTGKLPRYPIPVALIGRLAIERRAQRRGYGELLLGDALARVQAAAGQVGCLGVIVDAKDEAAERFYQQYGFHLLAGSDAYPRRLFLPMSTVAAAGA